MMDKFNYSQLLTRAKLEQLRTIAVSLIADDSYAMTFQTMGQYRTALMKRLAELDLQPHSQLNPDLVVMPKTLTAENGAKSALISEFHVTSEQTCSYCEGEGKASDGTDCIDCDGGGTQILFHDVPWDTIKNIYKKAVSVCEVKP
ncbi:hypothetical protein [Cellvibrio mixtus]|uniref:hypothetical protein n=1 Tax=Cellvibrio mixtus TaxID=39650 RepID=UPI00069380D1|nr:hypothetical protein [Cellvibrio mixtus]